MSLTERACNADTNIPNDNSRPAGQRTIRAWVPRNQCGIRGFFWGGQSTDDRRSCRLAQRRVDHLVERRDAHIAGVMGLRLRRLEGVHAVAADWFVL